MSTDIIATEIDPSSFGATQLIGSGKSINSLLPVLFVQTSMPVGGAETLLVNLVQGFDRTRFQPEVVCLKKPGPLGDLLIEKGITVHSRLLSHKYDIRVLPRLVQLIHSKQYQAVVTVGAGDKMFWGRLAARIAGVPFIASALHSTGWPDGVGRMNRWLTSITDRFIAVAKPHGEFLVDFEKFPEEKVVVIPNGVDTNRFQPHPQNNSIREELGIGPNVPLVGILAALRPEKNHEMFLHVARNVTRRIPEARFVVIGDGPERAELEQLATELSLLTKRGAAGSAVRFLGNRSDVPLLLSSLDVLALTSHNEANPVSILESLSCETPVVATDVGSVHESVQEGVTGHLVVPGDESVFTSRLIDLLFDPIKTKEFGQNGRAWVIENASLESMVNGYQRMIEQGISQT